MKYPRVYRMQHTYHLTRRCHRRLFRLPPNHFIRRLFLYCIALAAYRSKITVHAIVIMSNHYHLIVSADDWDSDISKFQHCINQNTAAVVNRHQGLSGIFWESGSFDCKPIHTEEALLNTLAYLICNPVKAGLVRRPEQWPGVLTTANMIVSFSAWFDRPPEFGPGSEKPDKVKLTLKKPLIFNHWSNSQFVSAVQERVDNKLEEIWKTRAEAGQGYLGQAAIRAQRIDQNPESFQAETNNEPLDAETQARLSRPKKKRRKSTPEEKAFRKQYKEALARALAGEDAIFPYGTYKMVRYFGYREAAPARLE